MIKRFLLSGVRFSMPIREPMKFADARIVQHPIHRRSNLIEASIHSFISSKRQTVGGSELA
jgi:hypothetical protein